MFSSAKATPSLGDVAHAGAVGQVLTKKHGEVLVGAALPRTIWSGEMDLRLEACSSSA